MSITVFSLVAKNLGSQVWGISGVTAGTNVTPAAAVEVLAERRASMTNRRKLRKLRPTIEPWKASWKVDGS